MKDFIGNEFKIGDYVAAGGKGNSSAEYGMILFRVVSVSPRLQLLRLTVQYPTYSTTNIVIGPHKITATNLNRYVVIQPPANVIDLFERAVAGEANLTPDEKKLLGQWIHGADHQKVWG